MLQHVIDACKESASYIQHNSHRTNVMAKTTGPLLSFGARGQIGKTLVFSSWKGTNYARQHVVPSNPQTNEQNLTRNAFQWLQSVYKVAPSAFTEAWEAYVKGIPMTARNAFTKFNLPNLRDQTDVALFDFSPGALGGLPLETFTVTPGNDQLTLAGTVPSVLPTGWTVHGVIFACIQEQNPQSGTLFNIQAVEDTSSAYSQVITGLANAAHYRCGGWIKWNRPDGSYAYSPALTADGLTT